MDAIELKSFRLGVLSTNCYLIFNRGSKTGFMVDCPAPLEEVNLFIEEQGLEILFVMLTHAHFDHINGLGACPFPFYVHEKDMPLLNNPELNGSLLFSDPVTIEKKPGVYSEEHYFSGRRLSVIPTPGHTPGSVSLKIDGWLFSGDTLFLDSVGRTDIPLASHDILLKAIKEKILVLPEETVVYPGHGPSTTVGRETSRNPFLQ